jgi:hypothetical protein
MFYCEGGTRWRSHRSVAFSRGMKWDWEMGEFRMLRGHRHLRICMVKWFMWKIAFLELMLCCISICFSQSSVRQQHLLYHQVLSGNCNQCKLRSTCHMRHFHNTFEVSRNMSHVLVGICEEHLSDLFYKRYLSVCSSVCLFVVYLYNCLFIYLLSICLIWVSVRLSVDM